MPTLVSSSSGAFSISTEVGKLDEVACEFSLEEADLDPLRFLLIPPGVTAGAMLPLLPPEAKFILEEPCESVRCLERLLVCPLLEFIVLELFLVFEVVESPMVDKFFGHWRECLKFMCTPSTLTC